MNKLTKVGCSALCGSLAAISAANAGDLTVTGGADMTWISKGSEVTGNPLGIGSNTTLNGSGELDNGWTFSLAIANLNTQAFSSAAINLTMGGLGSLNFNQGDSGNGIQAIDDKMPTAWEEIHGAGVSTGVRGLVSGVGASQNVQYTTPTLYGTTLVIAVAPVMGQADISDKGTGGLTAGANKAGYDATININPSMGTELLSGLNVFVGGHLGEKHKNNGVNEDAYQATAGVTFDIGPISLGAQKSGEYSGTETITSPTYHTYLNHTYAVAFNVNDDLSVSWGSMESRKAGYNKSVAQTTNEEGRRVRVEGVQAAYTMGGASLRVANVTVDNAFFSTSDSADRSATVVSLGLAF
jgi:outer membrane protein OmpU